MFMLEDQYTFKDVNALNEDVMFAKHPNLIRCEKILQDIIDEDQKIIPDRALQGKRTKEVQDILKDHFQFNFFTLSIGEYMDPIMHGMFNLTGNVNAYKLEKKGATADEIQLQKTQFRAAFIGLINSPNAFNASGMALPNALKRFFSGSSDYVINDGTKIKFNKNKLITDGMVTILPKFYRNTAKKAPTGGELLGIILHEVGHSFYLGSRLARTIDLIAGFKSILMYACTKLSIWVYQAISSLFGMNSTTNYVYGKVIGVIDQLLNLNYILEGLFNSDKEVRTQVILSLGKSGFSKAFITMVESYISKDLAKVLEIAGVKVSNILDVLTPIIGFINTLANIITKPAQVIVSSIVSMARMDGKECETFCDMFATVHGYGTELHSFFMYPELQKNTEQMKMSSDGIASFMQNLGVIESVFSLPYILDPHPETSNRAFVTLENLKKLKNQASSKAQRDVIDRQISDIVRLHGMVKKADKEKVANAFKSGNFEDAYKIVYGRNWSEQVLFVRSVNEMINSAFKQIDDGINKLTGSTTYRTMAELDKTVKQTKG